MPGIGARSTLASTVVACALALAGCGQDEGTIPRDRGEQLLAQLAEIEDLVDRSECEAARLTAAEFARGVEELPRQVDREVRTALAEASTRLEALVADPSQCSAPDSGTTDAAGATDEAASEPAPPPAEATAPPAPPEEPPAVDQSQGTPPGQGQGQGQGQGGGAGTAGGIEAGG